MISTLKTSAYVFFLSLFFLGCASQPVMLHPSRQGAPAKASTNTAGSASKITPAPIKKSEPAPTPVVATAPAAAKPAAPVKDIKIVPKVQSPEILLTNINNPTAAEGIIENKLNLNELEAAAADPELATYKPQLLLKIGKTYQKNKDPDRAGEYFRALTTLYPQSVYSTQAAILLSSLQSSGEADSNVIGAILPLSGRNASVGQHALNAIRLGLGLNKGEKKFRIALFDSQSDPELAAKGVDKLTTEDKVIAILGGFTAKEAQSIALRAELLSVPFVGFSQKSGLTNVGEYIFRNALTPEMQVSRLVDFAFEKLSAKKFAILYPNDSYGIEFTNVFWDYVLARGGQITAAETYDPKSTDFSEVTQKLVGTYYLDARKDELEQRKRDQKAAAKKLAKANKDKPLVHKSTRDSYGEVNLLPPIVDFDVLFVPDSSRALGQVLAFMKFNDVTDMNYLGTNIWNSADLPKRAANEDAGIYFVDALDMSDVSIRENDFFKDYVATYNEEPTLVEIQAYEAAKILKDRIVDGASSREALATSLRVMGSSSHGVTGELNMTKTRELVRPIHLMMLDTGVVKKVE